MHDEMTITVCDHMMLWFAMYMYTCIYIPLKVLFIAFTYSVVGLSGIVSAITAAGGDLPPLYLYRATQDTTSAWSLDIER